VACWSFHPASECRGCIHVERCFRLLGKSFPPTYYPTYGLLSCPEELCGTSVRNLVSRHADNNPQIGKTSGLVMTLCGVLKNILLVIASVLIWATIITPLQFVGYGIATCGLIYYGVGYDGIVTYYTATLAYAKKMWEGETDAATGTMLRKAVIVTLYATIFILLAVGIAVRSGKAPEFLTDRLAYP